MANNSGVAFSLLFSIYSRVCMLVYRVILYPLNIQFGQLIYTGKSMHTISTSNRLREAGPGTMKY